MSTMSRAELGAYMRRVEVVREAFNRLGRGAQQSASFDIRVAPSRVSSVVRGRVIDERILGELEGWLADQLAPPPSVVEGVDGVAGD